MAVLLSLRSFHMVGGVFRPSERPAKHHALMLGDSRRGGSCEAAKSAAYHRFANDSRLLQTVFCILIRMLSVNRLLGFEGRETVCVWGSPGAHFSIFYPIAWKVPDTLMADPVRIMK